MAEQTLAELAESEGDGTFMLGLLREAIDVRVVARFTIDGEPASKSRARWSPKTGRHYTPDGTRVAERQVAWTFRQAAPSHTPKPTDSYGVLAGFFCGTGQRRDVDNMLKLVLDGLNKIAWVDDSQVTEVSGRLQRFNSHPRTEVVVYRTVTSAAPTKPCEVCGTPFRAYPSQNDGPRQRRFCSRECVAAQVREKNRRTCLHCSKEFQDKRPDAKYCSKTCAYTAKHATLTCTHCGVEFTRAQSLTRRTKNPMCSDECRAAYWRERRTAAAKGACETCGGPTSKKTYRRCNACRLARSTA